MFLVFIVLISSSPLAKSKMTTINLDLKTIELFYNSILTETPNCDVKMTKVGSAKKYFYLMIAIFHGM